MIKQFQMMLKKEDLAESTIQGYSSDMLAFNNWVSDIRKSSVTVEEIDIIDIKA